MKTKQYRKRPVVIEAQHFSTYFDAYGIAAWCGGTAGQDVGIGPVYVDIPTKEGVMRASVGDYVIRGVAGEFYPCKPDIFKATYDEVDRASVVRITLCVEDDVASFFRDGQASASGEIGAKLVSDAAIQFGAVVNALVPDCHVVGALKSFSTVEVADLEMATAAVAAFRQCSGVKAAYIKPPDSLP